MADDDGMHESPAPEHQLPDMHAPIALFEWELTAAPMSLWLQREVPLARVLVRHQGSPLGWLQLVRPGQSISDARLRRELVAQLPQATLRSVVRQQLDAQLPLAEALATPFISVVVCTRDRTDSLARCLDALLAMSYPSFEIIVVDNAPTTTMTADCVAQLRRASARAHDLLRHVHEPTPGLNWARNRGLRESRGEIVAYTDDDVRVDARWLHGLQRGFADASIELVTGLVVPAELETDAQVIFEDFYGGMGKGMQSGVFGNTETHAHTRLGAHHVGVGANLAVRRQWLHTLGGFDTALDVGTASQGGGDLDIIFRTFAAGGAARYEPSALVHHHHRREMHALRRQLRDNGRAFGVYLLTRWSRQDERRLHVARYAFGTWLPWMVRRVPRRLLRREKLPIPLQLQEWLGAASAPWVWFVTYRHDRDLRRELSRNNTVVGN